MADEYIKRKAAYNAIVKNYDTDAQLRDLDAIPAVDAVPVVRCKNCLRWKRDAYGGVCDRYGVRLNEEWFCAGGEWREVDYED